MEGAPRGGQLHDPPLRNVGHAPVATHRGFAARYMDFLGLELALNASILRWIPAVLAFSLVVHAGAAWLLPARGLAAAMKELGSLIVDELVCGKRDPARQNDLDACFSGWAVKESLNFFTPSAHEAFRVGSVLGEVFGFSCLYGFLLVVCAVLVALALPRGPVLLRVSMKCMYACGTFIVLAPLGGIAFLLIKSEKWAGAVASATTPTFDGANLMFPQFSQGIPVENTTGQLTLNFDDSTSLQGGLESIPLRDLYFQGLDVLHNVTQLGEVLPEVIGTHISEALPSLSQLQNAASATESGACPAEDRDCLSEKLKQKQSGTSTFAGEQCPADGQVCAAPHGKNEFDSKTAIEKSNPSRTQTPGTPANFHIFGSTPESDASAANQTVSLVCMLEDVFLCRGFADGDCPPEVEEGPCSGRREARTPGSSLNSDLCRCYKCPKKAGIDKNRGCMTAFLVRSDNVRKNWTGSAVVKSKMYSLGNELAFIAAVIAMASLSIICCI